MNVDEEPYCNMKTYVHMGMFATAVTIQNILFENEVLQRAFEKHPVSSIQLFNCAAHIAWMFHTCSPPNGAWS